MDRRPLRVASAALVAVFAAGLLATTPAAATAPRPALGAWRGDGPTRTVIDTLTPLGTGRIALLSQNADGVRRSADGGLTWTMPSGLSAHDLGSAATSTSLAVLGSDPTRAYLVVAGSPSGIPYGVSGAALRAAAPPGPAESPSPSPTASPEGSPGPDGTTGSTGPWLYATGDAGASWARIPGDGLKGRIVFALAAVPATRAALPTLLAADGTDGVLRSTDGGATFQVATRGIAPDPDAGGIVVTALAAGSGVGVAFASTTNGIYRSPDGGATWTRTCAVSPDLPCGRPYVAPEDPSIVLAADFHGLTRSADGGVTWEVAGTGTLPGSEDGGIDSVAIGGGTVPVAWASGPAGLFHSTDGGVTWAPWQGGIDADEGAGSDRIAADPTDATRAWRVHGLALFVTDDGGHSWAEMAGPDAVGITAYAAFADGDGTRLVGSDAGVVLRTERRWETTRPDTVALDIEVTAGTGGEGPGPVYAATYAAGILRSDDGGASWADWSRGLPHGPAWDVAAPAVLGGRVLVATEYGAFERDAEGDGAWAALGTGLPDAAVRTLVVTAAGDVLVGLETRGVWRLPHGEDAWRRVGLDRRSVLSLAAATPNGRILLAATDRAGLWRSTDAGRTWRRVAATRASASVAFDPVTATAVLATGPSILASTDTGRTWRPLVAGLPPADPAAAWRRSTTRVTPAGGGGIVLTTLGGTFIALPETAP